MNLLNKVFLNEKFILLLIAFNAITIFLLEQFEKKFQNIKSILIFFYEIFGQYEKTL